MKKKQWHMKNEIDVSQADEAPAQKKIMNLELVAPMAPERMRVRSDDYEAAQINVAMVGTMRQVVSPGFFCVGPTICATSILF
jgi:hypothetical protein